VVYRDFLEPAADLVDIEASVAYPDSLQLMAPGVLEVNSSEGQATARMELEAASGLPLFIAAGYQLDSTTVQGAALKLYYQEDDSFIIDTVRVVAGAAMNYMSNYVLPYPYDELVIVIGGLSAGGGLEQPRMILASRPPRAAFARFYPAMITHEVVHQWFYGIVNSNQAEHPWLDEAVTEYLGLKIDHDRAGGSPDLLDVFGLTVDHATLNRMRARSVMETDPVTRNGTDFYDRWAYYDAVYSKGMLVLQTLCRLMGDDNEQRFWQDYAGSFAYSVPEPEDFVRIANNYLPTTEEGDALTILENTSATDFAIISLSTEATADTAQSEEGVAAKKHGWTATVEYLAQHPLGFPVDLRVEFLDGRTIDTVLNPTSGKHRLEFTSDSPALAAIIDPEFKYAVDRDYLNNSLVRERSKGAALRLFSGITFLVESLFSSLWGW
jgi:hypothetical protein